MKHSRQRSGTPSRLSHFCFFLLAAGLLLSDIASAAPSITLSKKTGPPTSPILVSGRGFESNVGVDIYFGTKDEALVVTNDKGEFHNAGAHAPRSAYPGQHWVTALERNNDKGAQKPFVVQTNWSQFRFSDNLTGLNPFENVLNRHTANRLDLKWTFFTRYEVTAPAVFDGAVYFGSGDGNVYAVKAASGTELWSFNTNGSTVYSDLAVAKGIVYVGSEDGNLYALKASDGKELWRFNTFDYVGTPTVADDVVYVGSETGKLYALNARTGTELWSFYTGSWWVSGVALVNGMIYFGANNGNVYALNAKDGTMLWSYATNNYATGPAVADGVVYAPSWDDTLYALDSATGTLLWKYTTSGGLTCSPAVADGVVYLGSNGGDVYALDAHTGAELWSAPAGGCYGSSPAIANGVLYASDESHIFALEAATGKELWSYATGGSCLSVVNGMVFVGSAPNLYAFSLAERGEVPAQGSRRPSLKILRPDFSLKVSQPVATASHY